MRQKMSLSSRRELLNRVIGRYRGSTWKDKRRILDEFVSGTGYGRKYAVTLLNHGTYDASAKKAKKPRPARRYDEAVRLVLSTVWKAANRICSKRLIPFLPEFVASLERFGHLALTEEVRERLLTMSPATADRLLRRERYPAGSSVSTTRRGKLLKHQIAVRTFFDWNELTPGFMEADLVAHCGDRAEGAFLNTLVLTDIATGWTECVALLRRGEADVSGAIHAIRSCLPFSLLGLDTDNGGEFINYELLRYCQEEKITFTRSRAYRKNDQAHVEEKNGSVVRRLVGYDRYEGMEAWRALSAVYAVLRLYVNFFQPSMKLLSKERMQGRTTKRYDRAQTPYQRALSASVIGEDQKNRLRAAYRTLDPVVLLKELERLQDQFWAHAHNKPAVPRCSVVPESVSGKRDPLQGSPTLIAMPAVEESQSCTAEEDPASNNFQPTARENPVYNGPGREISRGTAILTPPDFGGRRTYRRTKRPSVPHTWRTRVDPFAEVWGQIQVQVDSNPGRCAKKLFLDLQERYPGKFPNGQLRTFQRRVQRRRREQHLDSAEAIHHPAWATTTESAPLSATTFQSLGHGTPASVRYGDGGRGR